MVLASYDRFIRFGRTKLEVIEAKDCLGEQIGKVVATNDQFVAELVLAGIELSYLGLEFQKVVLEEIDSGFTLLFGDIELEQSSVVLTPGLADLIKQLIDALIDGADFALYDFDGLATSLDTGLIGLGVLGTSRHSSSWLMVDCGLYIITL